MIIENTLAETEIKKRLSCVITAVMFYDEKPYRTETFNLLFGDGISIKYDKFSMEIL